jgi:hypothetical protein
VLAWYEKPLSEEEPVVCIDEKPVVLHTDLRRPRPMYPGRTLRRDSEYERRGTANVFCGVEPKAGRHYPCVTPDRSGGNPIASDPAHWGEKQIRCAEDFCRGFTPTV